VGMHASETFVLPDEGLRVVSGRGRGSVLAADPTVRFRFSRMCPKGDGTQLTKSTIKRIANEMVARDGGESGIPAGFTYLGQFIAHDVSFAEKVPLGRSIAPSRLAQRCSPSLDLDSVYGDGPRDPDADQCYERDRIHLKMGRTGAAEGIPAMSGFDLPRGSGSTPARKRKALIADPRNDENLAVAQTHLAFIRFHNRVVDTLASSVPRRDRFETARDLVTKHYQWMIRTDYLPRICAESVLDSVFNQNRRRAFEADAQPTDVPTMPIEFSAAAFRLGHSMARAAYEWNAQRDPSIATLDRLFELSAGGGRLAGLPRLPSPWIADFRRLYDFTEAGRSDLASPEGRPNLAMRIDTTLVDPVGDLPPAAFDARSAPRNAPERNLAFRNLMRARDLGLPTGQEMFEFLKSKGVRLTQLTRAQIRDGKKGAGLDSLTGPQRDALLANTPLWFYILREAELNGGRLKGVGARIVAETFHRSMQGSKASIVREPAWRPTLGPNKTTFRMVDLLLFAFDGQKALLAPLE
jgi:Animal haem peroxidase